MAVLRLILNNFKRIDRIVRKKFAGLKHRVVKLITMTDVTVYLKKCIPH